MKRLATVLERGDALMGRERKAIRLVELVEKGTETKFVSKYSVKKEIVKLHSNMAAEKKSMKLKAFSSL